MPTPLARLPPVTDPHDQDTQGAVLDIKNRLTIAHYYVAPETALQPRQRLAGTAQIIMRGNPLIHEIHVVPCHLTVAHAHNCNLFESAHSIAQINIFPHTSRRM